MFSVYFLAILCLCLEWKKVIHFVCILQKPTVYAWHMYCMCLCLNVCVGSCVVRRACYTLTGRDRWSEMHDGILWWAGRVWINMVDFNSPCCVCVRVCVCVCVCVFVCETIRPVCLSCVHWSFLLKPSWIFFPLKYSVLSLSSFLPLLTTQLHLLLSRRWPLQT